MNAPLVTVVIATYNQPDALAAAIQSVQGQTESRWQMLIVGDHCTESTAKRIEGFDDVRIRYVNLSGRTGEQSVPNNIGMALADSHYIALLNQDDLWFPDHLECALHSIEINQASFFTGLAVFANPPPSDSGAPVFSGIAPIKRRLADAFSAPNRLFEPCSSWVFTRDLVLQIGYWQAAVNLYRTPLADWVLRAARAGVAHSTGERITVIKNNAKGDTQSSKPLYLQDLAPTDTWLAMLSEENAETFRQGIASELNVARRDGYFDDFSYHEGPNGYPEAATRRLDEAAKHRFFADGSDAMDEVCRACGLGRGWRLAHSLKERTGESLPAAADFSALLKDAARQIVTN